MKKLVKFVLGIVASAMVIGALSGCMSDPVADDFTKFMNEDMVEVNANYEALKAESGKWESFETNEEMTNSISNVILPNINESLDKLAAIEPQTDEVKAIKDLYVKMLNTYKEGYGIMLEACNTDDETLVDQASAKIEEGLKLLDEYNSALEKLAKEKDLEVQY